MVNQTTHASAFQATSVSETRLRLAVLAAVGPVLALACAGAVAQTALPQGGSVASGAVGISQTSPNSMTINQGSDTAIVNWNSFSIGNGGHVDIRQPDSSSSILNRVTGSTTSQIHGRLTANGQVHLVNPNGIFIGANGKVAAGAFAASTLSISDEDFNAGRLRYSGAGASAGVRNAGSVTIGRGGYAALIGGKVDNSGTVIVPMGRIGFAAGELVTLDVSGDQFLQVAIPSGGDDDGDALIDNSGTVRADGGLIEMRAATARSAARNAINLSGIAEASSVSVRGGVITLGGGAGGTVTVSGRTTARSTRPAPVRAPEVTVSARPMARGGEITVTGAQIVLDGAQMDASGDAGGGLIRIGGDFAGQGPLPRADTLSANAATSISADALDRGDGGRIAVWSDVATDFAGTLSARGGDAGGDGGFVEVSSKRTLNYTGLADRRAPLGEWGMLLLDPEDIVINSGAGGQDTLEANLELGNVTLDTGNPSAFDDGDITINADLSWGSFNALILQADNDIALNGSVTAPDGSLILNAVGDIALTGAIETNRFFLTGNDISTTAATDINVGLFLLNQGSWSQVGPELPDFNVRNFQVSSGSTDFMRARGGDGTAADPYQLFDVYGLQGMDSAFFRNDNFVLADNINASGTEGWEAFNFTGSGFNPIDLFQGSLNGQNYEISGLFIDGETPEGDGGSFVFDSGLFDTIGSNGRVSNLTISDANVNGFDTGILAAGNDGSVNAVRVSGRVGGIGSEIGGMIGFNFGVVSDSIAEVQTSSFVESDATGLVNVGGFVGQNQGTITRSHATGNVDVLNTSPDAVVYAGGFAGFEVISTTISDSYAHGDVSLTSNVGDTVFATLGGFVGADSGLVLRSYSTGSIVNTGDADVLIGGFSALAGSPPSVETNFWDVTASGTATSASGTGLSTTQFQDTLAFFNIGNGVGWNFDSVWAPGSEGNYPVNYSTSPVVFAIPDSFDAESAPVSVQYGQTALAVAGNSVSGGPEGFLFGIPGDIADILDTSPLDAGLVFSDQSVGPRPFALGVSSLESALGLQYRVVSLEGRANITRAPLTITADGREKTYGQTVEFAGTEFDPVGLFFEDTVERVTLTSDGAAATAQVADGPFAIAASDAVGTGLENYEISYVDGFLSVLRAPLTITADGREKTYGQTVEFAGTEFDPVGLFFEDTVESVTLTSDGAAATAQVADGPFAIAASDAVGTGLENYEISYVDGFLSVLRAPLTITADGREKTYGQTVEFAGTEFDPVGLFFEDTVERVTLTSDGAAATAQVADGPFAIAASDAVGTGLENYEISYVDGFLSVLRAPLTITADGREKTYGQTVEFAGTEFDPVGLFFEDTVESVTLTSDGAAATAQVADGPFAIAASDAVGTGLENYEISYVDGFLSVLRAPLTITADGREKTYGQTVEFAGTEFDPVGLFFEDTVESVTLTSDGAAATAQVADGPFAIAASDAVGTGLENYEISYVDGFLSVLRAPLTITADGREKTYGQTVEFAGTEFDPVGLFFEDTVERVTLTSDGAAATAQVADGPFAIAASDAVGTGLENYEISYVDGFLSVLRAPLTITADDASKDEGVELEFDGTEFSLTGLVEGDAVRSVTLNSAGADADARAEDSPFEIAIAAGSAVGTGLGNYDITLSHGTLIVEPVEGPIEEPAPPVVPVPPVFIGFGLPNPSDSIVLSDGEQAGAPGGIRTGTPVRLQAAEEALTRVDTISGRFEAAASACGQGSGGSSRYLACLSDSLNEFANELDAISADLPPGLRNVARIVQDARLSVDRARTRAQTRLATAGSDTEREAIQRDAFNEARAALDFASGEIRKAIALVRVEDPELADVERATITRISSAVDTVGIQLSRAVDL